MTTLQEVQKDSLTKPDSGAKSSSRTQVGAPIEPWKTKWWNNGGMNVNEVGMGINVLGGPAFLLWAASSHPNFAFYRSVFLAVLALNVIASWTIHQMRGIYCVIVVPLYLSSTLLVGMAQEHPSITHILQVMSVCILLAMIRVGICMSVCLHRYAAHQAFKCGPVTQLFLNVLGCAAHQGGPIWWASQHRLHHKYCDLPQDPHSALQVGTEKAFDFFAEHNTVDEGFAPPYNDNWYLRILSTWSFAVVTLEMMASFALGGWEGLFISYTSTWVCQTITLWFNIANHPLDVPGDCKAANYKARPDSYFPIFWLLDFMYPYFGYLVSEANHEHHHKYSQLAKRDPTDCGYFFFIMPLEMVGLVWDVKICENLKQM